MLSLRLRKQICYTIAGVILLANILSPAFAEDISLTANGSSSNDTATIAGNTTTTVNQQNVTNVSNAVVTSSNTGGNTTTNNTGENTSVSTGDTLSSTTATTQANKNVTQVGQPTNGNTSVTISGNGSGSSNSLNVSSGTQTNISQTNTGNISSISSDDQNTGKNNASENTGGNTQVTAGNIDANTTLVTKANKNNIVGSGDGEQLVSLMIKNNGSNSQNRITVTFPKQIRILSNNELNLYQNAVCKQNTGKNTVSKNTGGSAMLTTGNAGCNIHVKVKVNVNKLKLQKKQIVPTITPIVTPAQVTPSQVTSSNQVTSAPSNVSAVSNVESISEISPAQQEQVLGVSAAVLPVTGSNIWENFLFYILLASAGVFLNYLSKRKILFIQISLH